MKIDSIKIRNFKGFKECDLEFHPNVNVFIGSNASGKTTILNAIIKSIYSLTGSFVRSSSHQKLILSNEDINYNSTFASIYSKFSKFPNYENDIDTQLTLGDVPEELIEQNYENNGISSSKNQFVKIFRNNIAHSPTDVPIIKFYPSNRGSVSYTYSNRDEIRQISQLETWSNIYQDNLSYSKFFHWFFENETNELRLQRDLKDFNIQSPDLKNVRQALYSVFDYLDFGNYKLVSKQEKRKGSSKLIPTLKLINQNNDFEEDISSKSDGEKAIITLVADIAYNLSLSKDFTVDDNFLNSFGIVIIDEIETHLHPKWQREILPILTKIFPNIQFFIATHSPQIISSVESDCVFISENFNIDKAKLKTKGEDSNSLLKYAFESTDRPKPFINLIKRFNDLIDNNAKVDEIQKVINEIQSLYNQDTGIGISNLIDELNIKLSAYLFEKEYEENN